MVFLCIPIDIHFCGLWQALKSISFPQGPRQRNEFIQHPSLWLWLRVVIQPLQACRTLHIYPGLSIQIDVQMFVHIALYIPSEQSLELVQMMQALRRAVSMAPRGKRNMEMLNVAVAWQVDLKPPKPQIMFEQD